MIVEKLKVRDPVTAATIGDLEAEHQEGTRRLRRVERCSHRTGHALKMADRSDPFYQPGFEEKFNRLRRNILKMEEEAEAERAD